jgi:sugar lactone lactonase YvrE
LGTIYQVKEFCHGLQITDLGADPEIKTTLDSVPLDAAPAPVASDLPDLPARDSWVNVAALGAKGDGVTDETAVLKKAIAEHRCLYFPTGRYRVTETITLQPDTVLIGLNPITTQLILSDATPAFTGPGAPKALLETPRGGTNIVTGIGLNTGAEARAIGAKWMAGKDSYMNDVRFLGGHGTYEADGQPVPVYNSNRTADANPARQWDSQYYSLWVTEGGGGTFKDIWSPNPYAQAGICISETETCGRMYAISVEHHVRNEIKLRNISNWSFYAIQTEEEKGESPRALPLSIENCSNLTFANLYNYRVAPCPPFQAGIKVQNARDIRFRGVHVYSPGKNTFDNTLVDATSGVEVRSREIASLILSGTPHPASGTVSAIGSEQVEKLAGGFEAIDGAAVDKEGNVYFVDPRRNQIFRWDAEKRSVELLRDSPIAPASLVFDPSGNLLVITRTGMVYAFRPEAKEDEISVLQPIPATTRPRSTPVFAVNCWRDAHDFIPYMTQARPEHYLSPDGALFIPAVSEFKSIGGGWREPCTMDLYRAYGLTKAIPGQPVYLADEFGQKTWSFQVQPDGTLSAPKLFAEEGEAGVAVDASGNVYVAAGQIFVYSPSGKKIGVIHMPERPASLVFGGKDGKTLFITARTSLYAIRCDFGAHK